MTGCGVQALALAMRLLLLLFLLQSSTKSRAKPLPPVQVSVPRGFQERAFALTMTAPKGGAIIRYTTDGSEPTLGNGFTFGQPIAIASNTILRVRAFKGQSPISSTATHSYLFLSQVLHQPLNPPDFPSTWNGMPAVYGMHPRVVSDPEYRNRMKGAFQALPVLSVVCRTADLFDASQGLYVNSLQHGENWEKPCSAEFILTNGHTGFQIDCGIRMQGNSNRMPQKSQKHSFRLMFKSKYGPAKLHYPIFPETTRDKFDSLVLRADYNNSWIHWDARARPRAQRVRDAWLKDSQRAMGWAAGHTRFVHLFLNGLYWGIYDFTERPDANFAADYLGGKPEDYDVINEMQAKDGKMDAFNAFYSVHSFASPEQYEKLQKHLNITEYIDYLLLHFYAGNQDIGEDKNWYAIRRRTPPGLFQYVVWDGEQILQDINDDTVSRPYEVPFRLAEELRANAEFRMAFADRVQKHLFNGGALTPGPAAARWRNRAAEVDEAMIAESARWGYYRRKTPYTRDAEYAEEQQRLLKDYFPQRTAIVVEQLRNAGLYPNIAAPLFSQSGGRVTDGYKLTMEAPEGGVVYYTTNGIDPRSHGTDKASAEAQTFGKPISLHPPLQVRARTLKNGTWSALVDASFTANK
jgi:hypothetical protein